MSSSAAAAAVQQTIANNTTSPHHLTNPQHSSTISTIILQIVREFLHQLVLLLGADNMSWPEWLQPHIGNYAYAY
jgi:hypothetical protein